MFSLSNVILLMLLTVVATSQLDLVSIDVENWESAPVSIVDPRELSWNYGVWMYDHKAFNRQNTALNFSSTQLAKLTRQLGKAIWRVGGTKTESAQIEGDDVFVPLPPDVDPEGRFAQFNISKSDWRTFADFMAVSNMDLMLGLNQITRRWPNGQKCTGERGACPWDSTNARAFMEHNRDAGIPVWGYELGNEPGCYMARDDQPTFSKSLGITPQDGADDYQTYSALVAQVYKDSTGPLPKVIGPSTGGCNHAELNEKILDGGARPNVDSFHHYVLGSAVEQHGGIIDSALMAQAALSSVTRDAISSYLPAKKRNMPDAALWIGEGATTCQSTAHLKSFAMIYNTFNILREGGLLGVELFVQHNILRFFRNCNESDGELCDYQPVSSYWFAYLWKRVMGAADNGRAENMQVYQARTSLPTVLAAVRGRAIAALNLGEADVTARFSGFSGFGSRTSAETPTGIKSEAGAMCRVHTLTPDWTRGGPDGDEALVNGQRIVAAADGSLPTVQPAIVSCDAVSIPKSGVVFVTRS